jgi:hypothetical protein
MKKLPIEKVDKMIVDLLSLEPNEIDDIDYETYKRYLKELLIEITTGKRKIVGEESVLLKEELKRVKTKKGRFILKKTIEVTRKGYSNIRSSSKFIRPSQKLLPGSVDKTKEKEGDKLFSLVSSIRKSADNILSLLKEQNKLIIKNKEKERKKSENKRREFREESLEERKEGKGGFSEIIRKVISPFESILENIKKFLVFTILGRAFKLFMDWASNPENKKKLETVGRFLKDWWPALLGAWFLFTNPLGKFIRFIIGTVAKLTFKLAKFAIPKLAKFIAAHPKAAAAAALFTAGLTIPALFPQTIDEQERKTESAPGTKEDKIENLKNQKQNLSFFEKLQGKGSEIDEQINFLETGETKAYTFNTGGLVGLKRGALVSKPFSDFVNNEEGNVFSGTVDKDTGETVSGAGPDTQFLPIAGGGGAVLQKGETVLQVGARERMIQQAGVDPLAYNVGNNANKPRKINANTLASSNGGLIGLNNGGVLGGSPAQINLQLSDSQKNALEVLGKYESKSSGGYNAVNQIGTKGGRGVSGFSGDFTKMKQHKGKSLTDLTLEEIIKLQHDDRTLSDQQWIDSGKLHAVGKYQIVGNTLPELISKLNLPTNTKFSPVIQDAMALQLMKERGIQPWVGPSDKATPEERLIIENARKEKISISKSNPKLSGKVIDSKKIGNSVYTEREGGIYTRNGVPIPKAQYTAQVKKSPSLNPIQKLISPIFGGAAQASTTNNQTKSNHQRLVEKRPWWDKAGWFGGASAMQKKQDGGMIENPKNGIFESFGTLGHDDNNYAAGGKISVSSGFRNPYSSSDSRLLPIMNNPIDGFVGIQPGEGVMTKLAMQRGGNFVLDTVNALLDPSSKSAKDGVILSKIKNKIDVPSPPSRRSVNNITTLPPITMPSSSNIPVQAAGSEVARFSAVSNDSLETRHKILDMYGVKRKING